MATTTPTSFLRLIAEDNVSKRVKVSLPGCTLTASDRYGEKPGHIHQRLQKCIHEVMVPKFGYDTSNKDANERPLTDVALWKDTFQCKDLPVSTLIATRQLALDFAASDAAELFGVDKNDPYDPVGGVFRHTNEQVAAFLAAKELLPDEVMDAFKKAFDAKVARSANIITETCTFTVNNKHRCINGQPSKET